MWFGLFAFGFGAMLGNAASCAGSEPEPEVIERTVTKTEEVEVPVEVAVIPEVCRAYIDSVQVIVDELPQLTTLAGEQQEILHEAGKAIASGDINQVNELMQQQLDLADGENAGIFTTLTRDLTHKQACEEALQ
jgi:hypothetical protein